MKRYFCRALMIVVAAVLVLPTAIVAGVFVDVPGDQTKDFVAQVRIGVDVLQGLEDGDDFVTAVEIEFDVQDGLAIQPLLARKRFSHP